MQTKSLRFLLIFIVYSGQFFKIVFGCILRNKSNVGSMLSFQFWIWQQNVSPGSLWCTTFVLCCVDDRSAAGRLLWVRWRIEASYVYVYMSVHVCTCMYMRVRFAYFQSCNMIWFPLLVREINIGFSKTMYTETGKHTPGCKIRTCSCLKISLHNLIT